MNTLQIYCARRSVKQESKLSLNHRILELLSQKQVEVIELIKSKVPLGEFYDFPPVNAERIQQQVLLLDSNQTTCWKVRELIEMETQTNQVIKEQLKQMDEVFIRRANELAEVEQGIQQLNTKLRDFVENNQLCNHEVLDLNDFSLRKAENLISAKHADQQSQLKQDHKETRCIGERREESHYQCRRRGQRGRGAAT